MTLTACALAACGTAAQDAPDPSAAAGQTATAEAQPDTSEEVVLKMFAVADAPLNQRLSDEYWPVLNDAVKEAVNATIDYTYASGNDYTNNYQLALASGEKYN